MSTADFAAAGCEECQYHMRESAAVNTRDWNPAAKTAELYRLVMMNLNHCKVAHPVKKQKTFAFTFTTNSNTKLEIQKEMCHSAYKLFLQKTTPVEEGEVYLEYTEEGRPHLHGWYQTQDGGRIFAKVFRRCWPQWGEKDRQTRFAGGYHEEMKTNRYKGYASAEGRLVVSKKKDGFVLWDINAEIYWPDKKDVDQEIEDAVKIDC